jgi:hypothetical protein
MKQQQNLSEKILPPTIETLKKLNYIPKEMKDHLLDDRAKLTGGKVPQ